MAGFDPATFWKLTLRQFHHRMTAAARRDEVAQARAAEAAWVGVHYPHADLVKYLDRLRGIDRSISVEHLVASLNAATNGLPTYTRADILQQRR